jgi:hypothetical protein
MALLHIIQQDDDIIESSRLVDVEYYDESSLFAERQQRP